MNPASETIRQDAQALKAFIRAHPRLTVLSGAGCSAASGIPEYRDDEGQWKHNRPMQYADFTANATNRKRYWAGSYAGWQRFANARPNAAHNAISVLEDRGYIQCVVTQNVDSLHQAAGSETVIDLHGALQDMRCLGCDNLTSRHRFQDILRAANPNWRATLSSVKPDGDAAVSKQDFESFVVPACESCGGVLKPDVVFFGESVPAEKVTAARTHLQSSDGLLVVGSSLMVFSGYRFAREASETTIPIAIVNRGITRADDLAHLKVQGDCTDVLLRATELLAA